MHLHRVDREWLKKAWSIVVAKIVPLLRLAAQRGLESIERGELYKKGALARAPNVTWLENEGWLVTSHFFPPTILTTCLSQDGVILWLGNCYLRDKNDVFLELLGTPLLRKKIFEKKIIFGQQFEIKVLEIKDIEIEIEPWGQSFFKVFKSILVHYLWSKLPISPVFENFNGHLRGINITSFNFTQVCKHRLRTISHVVHLQSFHVNFSPVSSSTPLFLTYWHLLLKRCCLCASIF